MKKSEIIKQLQKAANDYSPEFKKHHSKRPIEDCKRSLNNILAMQNPNSHFNRECKREIKRLDRAGMFNPNKLGAKYGLS